MEIPHRAFEEQPPDKREAGIPDPPVLPRHGARRDLSPACGQPATHHQIVALLELAHEALNSREIIAAVRVPQDHPFPPRRFNPSAQGAPIAFLLDEDHPRSCLPGDVSRAVGAPIIGDQHLAAQPCPLQAGAGHLNTPGQRFRLVEARHQDCQFAFVRHTHGRTAQSLSNPTFEEKSVWPRMCLRSSHRPGTRSHLPRSTSFCACRLNRA